jgi:Protein of unknown function (DUF2975)
MSEALHTSELSVERPYLLALRLKIGWLCQLIRWLIVAWVLWALYQNLEPLFRPGVVQSAAEWNAYWGLAEGTVSPSKVYVNRAIFLVSWASAAFLGWAVWRLMSSYLAGDIFSAAASARLKHVGIVGFASAAIDIIARPFALAALSPSILSKVPLLTWVEARDLLYFVIALFVLSLGHIQGTAATISDEHQQFV